MPTSRTISGILALVIICTPLIIAPFRLEQSSTFVREIENRQPNNLPRLTAPGDLADSTWWGAVSNAIEDRTPFRQQAVTLLQSAQTPFGQNDRSENVASGKDNWLFLRGSLGSDHDKPERIEQALGLIDSFMAHPDRAAPVYFLVAPDKVSLYPEQLTGESFAEYEPSIPLRNLLQDWFTQPGHPERIDLFRPMLAHKAESEVPIYNPQSSHCTPAASMLIAKAMIATDAPELWNDEFVQVRERNPKLPELARLTGQLHFREPFIDTYVVRPGVKCTSLTRDGKPIKKVSYWTVEKLGGYNDMHAINESRELPMIPGRTLVIHDSFVAKYLMPTLSQFYEDIRFIHFYALTEDILRDAMVNYDRIYIESVERRFTVRIIEHLAPFADD